MDLVAIQETRWPGRGLIEKKDYVLFYSGAEGQCRDFGTAFLLKAKHKQSVLSFEPLSERMCKLRLKGKFCNITAISTHAPTEDKDDDVKDAFYEDLRRAVESTPKHDALLLLGDFNAKVGREDYCRPTIGQYSLHEESNDNGMRLITFAMGTNLSIASTKFEHKRIHKQTWQSPDGRTRNQIDHIAISARYASNIQDVRSLRGANVDSDHFLVRARYRAKISNVKTIASSRGPKKWNTENLKDPALRIEYQERITEKLARLEDVPQSQNKWQAIKRVMLEAAEETIGVEGRKRRNDWYDQECLAAIADKNKARATMLQRRTRGSEEQYKEKRRTANRLLNRKKREAFRNEVEQLDTLRDKKETRKFYKNIGNVRKGHKNSCLMIKDAEGNLINDMEPILHRWAEYFSNLINNNDATPQNVVPDYPSDEEEVSPPTRTEIERAIKSLKNHKAAGSDSIPAELFKAGGPELTAALHQLVLKVWSDEAMPDDWKEGIVCPFFKKGDMFQCQNYRGITLLNAAYKILSVILCNRLGPYMEEGVGEYQCGFRKDRSTIDQIFGLRQIMEKTYEYNIWTWYLFIDFKSAYDKVQRPALWNAMREIGIPTKLINMAKMTMTDITSRVRIRNDMSPTFEVLNGLRQGDALAPLLFNIVLHKAIKDAGQDQNTMILNNSTQLLGYADDIGIVGRTRNDMEAAFLNIERAAKTIGLHINEDKTKAMVMARTGNPAPGVAMPVEQYTFEVCNNFTYLGSSINNKHDEEEEIKRRIAAGMRTMFSLSKVLNSKSVTRSSKCQVYKTLIRPVVSYGGETWTLNQKSIDMLNGFERRVLRKIFGGIQLPCGVWRVRMNHELRALYKEPELASFIKIQRLRWYGHLIRMQDTRAPKRLFKGRPGGRRPAGRPKSRWHDKVHEDLRELRVRQAERVARDRQGWRQIVEEAKDHWGL